MTGEKRFPWLAVLLGGGCVIILCIGVVVAGGGVAYFLNQRAVSQPAPELVSTLSAEVNEQPAIPTATPEQVIIAPTATTIPLITATSIPSPTVVPTTDDSGASSTNLTGEQRMDEHSFFEDFSSDAFGWPTYDDGMTILQYEDQAYSFQIKEPDYYDWLFFPGDFIPYEIWFDVQGPAGNQDGTFGVFCQYQDEDNYYYVEFDLADNTYIIAQILNGEQIPLTEPNSSGQYWQTASALNSPPTEVNRIGVSCYLPAIILYINDAWITQVDVDQPFEQPGDAAFFVFAYDFADDDGYKVFFDNLEVWQPVQ
jgi:hypothetical protein